MSPRPRCYVIRVEEMLDPRWSQWFAEMEILSADPQPGTLIRGVIRDQAALYGLISRLRDLNLTLVEIQRIEEDPWSVR